MKLFNRRDIDAKAFFMTLVFWFGLIVAMKWTGGVAFVVLIPLALLALTRRDHEQLIFILLVAISTILTNGYLMPKDMVYSMSERVLFVGLGFILFTQIAGQRNSRLLTPFLGLVPYLLFMAATSLAGWCPIISYLKLFLFTTIFFAYYAIANRAANQDLNIRRLRAMVLAMATFFVVGSVLVKPFGWAYMTLGELELQVTAETTNLFKGVTTHSNALGGVLAVFALILLGDMLFSLQRVEPLYIINLLCAFFLIVKSGSRTAMGTFVLGAGFAFYCFLQTRSVKRSWHGKVVQIAFLGGLVLGALILGSSAGREKIVRFVVKQRDKDAAVQLTREGVMSSRQGKIDEGLANWRKSPAIGNGFQVSEDMKGFSISSLRSVLSAPVEKSVWFAAVLEEGGALGFGLFVVFLLCAIPTLIKRKAYIGATLFFSLICGNCGEFTFFSMSGGGGLQWGMVFIGIILDEQRLRRGQRAAFNAQPPPFSLRSIRYL